MLDIDSQGIDFLCFVSEGPFRCVGKYTQYDFVYMIYNQWHTLDSDKLGGYGECIPLSIKNVEWAFTRREEQD